MSRRLQDFAFGKSKYERPTQKWVCGWAAEGNACHVGPDKKGRCIATSECFPLKKGDRWHCTRPENLGGRCGDGPLPDGACCRPIPRCQPVLSIRAKRNAFARWLSVLAFGVVLLLISSPGAPDFISSGELASHHNTVALSCSNCHSNFKGGPVAWFRKAVLFSRNTDDSPLCLSCHVLGEESQNPHGLSEKDLTGISQRIRKQPLPESKHAVFSLSSLFKLNPGDSQKRTVACVACHREHRGKDFDLAAMDDQRCQFCHTNKYASFSDGHPEFSGFPYVRRTRLIFNHFSHLTKHFKGEAKNQAPTTCKSCHVPDPSGSSMTVRNFETICDACHGSQILGEGRAGAKGIPFFTLPGLDVETLQEANVDIGEWPEGTEEEITPFMRFLLLANPKFKKLEADLGDADLLDLVDAEKAQLAAAGNLAWAVKGTLFELVSKGQKGLKEQLERALGRSLSAFELSSLSGLLPNDLVRSAQRSWLPRLFVEMARRSEKDLKEEDEKKKEEPEGEGGKRMRRKHLRMRRRASPVDGMCKIILCFISHLATRIFFWRVGSI